MQPSLFAREDTMLGVCEGLGQELGVDSNALRIACALALFWNPTATIVGYVTLGALLALFRWAFPFRAADKVAVAATATPLHRDNDDAVLPHTDAA